MTLRSQSRKETRQPIPLLSPETRTDSDDDDLNVQRIRSQNNGTPKNTRRRCDSCGNLFKGERGVRIHQGKSEGCKDSQLQRRVTTPKTVEDMGQELHHSVPNLVQLLSPNHQKP